MSFNSPRLFFDPQADLKAAQDLQGVVADLKDSFISLGTIIKQQISGNIQDSDRFTKAYGKTLANDISKNLTTMGKKSEDILKNSDLLAKGQAKSKDILNQILQTEKKRVSIAVDLENALKNNVINETEYLNSLSESTAKAKEQTDELKKQAIAAERTEKAMGNLGKLAQGLSKIPILGQFVQTEKVMEAMQLAAAKTGSKTAAMGAGFKAIGKSIKDGMLDPLTLITFILTQALKANSQIVAMGKSLGTSSESYRENLADIARSSTDINMTTANLVESFGELAKATGFAYQFNKDQLTTQTKLTKEVGLTAEEAGKIANLGITTGKTSESTYKNFVKGLVATRNQLKVGIDFKATLAEAANVSGRLAANLGYNPERIAKAVVTAKAFGMTLEQTSKIGDSLLNFESSINNELDAELLTGKQLNFERARAAALSGDQAVLAEEIAKNVGTAADFAKMNVLQQNALAAAVGMTSDELGNTLQKREAAIASGKSLAQINEEDAAKALERQSIQDKFNAAILKLQDFFGNLVAGPVGTFLDMLTNMLPLIEGIGVGMGIWWTASKGIALYNMLTSKSLMTQLAKLPALIGLKETEAAVETEGAIASISAASALTLGLGIISIVAGIAAAVAAMNSAKSAEDMISPANGRTQVSTKEGGLFELSKNDDLMAGPGLASKSKGGESMQGPSIDLTPMIVAINAVKASVDRLYGKDSSVHMDGKKVGTTLAQGSHKVA